MFVSCKVHFQPDSYFFTSAFLLHIKTNQSQAAGTYCLSAVTLTHVLVAIYCLQCSRKVQFSSVDIVDISTIQTSRR